MRRSGAARIAKVDSQLGSLTAGRLADMVLVEGDPTQRISDIRRPTAVLKDGVICYPAELYLEMGITPLSDCANGAKAPLRSVPAAQGRERVLPERAGSVARCSSRDPCGPRVRIGEDECQPDEATPVSRSTTR